MKKWKKVLTMFLALMMLVMSFAACSSGDADVSSDASSTQVADVKTDSDSEGVAAGATGDENSKTLTIMSDQNIATLDRYNGINGLAIVTINKLFADTLISSDYKGNYLPWLAEEFKLSDDGMSMTFKLRQDVTFSDGTALTAKDVQFTFERIRDDANLSDARKWAPFIGTVDTPDDYTVVLNFAKPMPTVFNELSTLPILCKAAYEKNPDTYFNAPVGSGPYTIAKFDSVNAEIELERRDDWWGWTAGKKSNVGTIIFKIITEGTTRVSALRAGEIQVCEGVPLDNIAILQSENYVVDNYAKTEHVFLALNSGENGTFASQKLREALSLCINRQLLVDSILGGGAACDWPALPGGVGYVKTDGYAYDPELAKQLVQESGYDGSEINLICTSGKITRGNEITQAIQAMAADAGINIKIEMLEDAAYNERSSAVGSYDIRLGAFGGIGGDFYNEVAEIIGGDRFNTGYKDAELSALTEQVTQTADPEKQQTLRAEIYQLMMTKFAPNVYLYQPQGCIAMGDNVEGAVIYPDSTADYRFVTLK